MNDVDIVPFLDPCRKSCDNNDDAKLVTVLEERVNVPCDGIVLPYRPVFSLILGSLRIDPSVNCLKIIHDITCCVHLGRRVNLSQECSCGRGK